MEYEIQRLANNEWISFSSATQYGIAYDICEWQQEKYKKYPNVQFRILEVSSQRIIVI
jgi:hypothetical protein